MWFVKAHLRARRRTTERRVLKVCVCVCVGVGARTLACVSVYERESDHGACDEVVGVKPTTCRCKVFSKMTQFTFAIVRKMGK